MSIAPTARWSELRRGLSMPFEAARLIFGRSELLGLALFPMLLTLCVTLVSLWAGYHWGQDWLARIWAQPDSCEHCSWYLSLWSWVSMSAWYLAWVAGMLAFSVVCGLLTSRVATALLMDSLAKRILDAIGVAALPDAIVFANHSTTRQVFRAIRRGLVLLAGYVVLGLLSLIPGAALITSPAGLIWTVLWLHVDNCCYTLQWIGPARIADVRALARENPWLTAGLMLSTCGLQLIPFVGLASTPIAVGGACLYVAQQPRLGVQRSTAMLIPTM